MHSKWQAIEDYQTKAFELEAIKDNLLRLQSLVEYRGAAITGMPKGTPEPDKMTDGVEAIIKQRKKYERAAVRLAEALDAAFDIISSQPHPANKILYLRYIACKEWEPIAKIMNYDVSSCRRIRDKAREALKRQATISGQRCV